MTIRPMTPADIPAGLRLCRASNWNQLEDDWRFFLEHGGAFVAAGNSGIIGTVAHLPFDRFTWLSMMLVDPGARRSGVGAALMQAVLEAIGESVRVRLDATPLGEPLYRRFGFVDEYPLGRAAVTPSIAARSGRARPIAAADLEKIGALDREVFGADRCALLGDLLRRAPDLAWQTDSAYCFGRPGYLRPHIGPLVARDAASARELLAHCVAAHPAAAFTVDVPRRPAGLEVVIERPFLRMCRGGAADSRNLGRVFAIAGPEFG